MHPADRIINLKLYSKLDVEIDAHGSWPLASR